MKSKKKLIIFIAIVAIIALSVYLLTNKVFANEGENTEENSNIVAEYEVTEAEEWKHTFSLPKYDENGKLINYEIDEKSVPEGYIKTIKDNIITHIITTNITGTIEWMDDNNALTLRPEKYTATLYGDGQELATKEFASGENWNFEHMPRYSSEDGHEIAYTIKTENITLENGDTYIAEVSDTNIKYKINGTVNVEAITKWVDDDNKNSTRPQSITVIVKEKTNIEGQ